MYWSAAVMALVPAKVLTVTLTVPARTGLQQVTSVSLTKLM